MQLNHENFEDLLGAYALDACDERETAALDAFVAEHPDAYAEVERLRGAAAWLGASGPLVPPPDLRTAVLAGARIVPASGADSYRAVTDALEAELQSFPAREAGAATINGLSVRDLVAHLTAIDRAFRDEIRTPTSGRPFINAAEVVDITRDALRHTGAASFVDVVARWNATRRELLDAAAGAPPDRNVMGYDVDAALVIRTFETWTHLDDIRRTRGRGGFVPDASVLRALADLSMRVVPFTLLATHRSRPGRTARIVLTGPGGKAWTVPLAAGEEPSAEADVVLTTGMLDWCYRFSDRLAPDELAMDVTGELELALEIVAAAPAFTSL